MTPQGIDLFVTGICIGFIAGALIQTTVIYVYSMRK